jgi:hypothetical protein
LVRDPAGGLQRADQLVVGQGAGAGHRLRGERREYRARAQHVGRLVLAERRGDRLSAQPVRAAHPRQQFRVHVAGVAKADRDGRTLDGRLRRRLNATLVDLPHQPREMRVQVEVIVGSGIRG